MNIVIFYEKPGCATNAKQKAKLRDAGCMVIERNLLEHGMSMEELLCFLKPLPVYSWFNPNAPDVKKGLLDPYAMNEARAIEALFNNPILIRRPLLAIKEYKLCGFDANRLEKILGKPLSVNNIESCSKTADSCDSN